MARIVTPRANGEQTREKILAVAERLFAAGGFDGVSMRDVGAAADVPFALVTYHFGSKLGLYEAVFKRRSAWIRADRAERLRAITLGDDPDANFAAIARALVEPSLRVRELPGGREFGRVMAREINDPAEGERGIVARYLDPTAHLVIDLLQRAAPDAPPARVVWAFEFADAALAWSHADTGRVGVCPGASRRPRTSTASSTS